MKYDFDTYKNIAHKAVDVLIENNCASLTDIKIIFSILIGFPMCLDEEGHYTYCGEFYESLEKMPVEAIQALLKVYDKGWSVVLTPEFMKKEL